MTSASPLVHIVDEVPELDSDPQRPPLPMVMVLTGFLDAGQSADLAARYLEEQTGGPVIATFDVDSLHDYRARRPAVTFVEDHYTDYAAPRLTVRLCRDASGSPFLLMHGPEPDIRWEAFAVAVRHLIERFRIDRVVALGAVPMAVPHTRPVALTPHANRPALLTMASPWRSQLRVPAGAGALVELRLGEWGHDALGFVAHVPHYLAQMEYPLGSLALLESVEQGAHISVDLEALRSRAEQSSQEIQQFLESQPEVSEAVQSLEQQYDALAEQNDPLDGQPLPTGEEIGRQFEQFLADLDGPHDER